MTTAPMNPLAGPSGPSIYSTRTDKLDMGSTSYGEGKETAAIKSAVPLATTPDTRPTPAAEVRAAAGEAITPLFAPSQRPDEPITSGVAVGPGPGPEVMGYAGQSEKLSDILSQMLPYDTDGEIAILYQQAVSRGL